MKSNARTVAAAVLAGAFALVLPLTATSQTATTGQQEAALYHYATQHQDEEMQLLTTLRNHIPVREIVLVKVGPMLNPPGHLYGWKIFYERHAALVAALSKPTVAGVDRHNGQSPDQSSLAEYLQYANVDPYNVVAVDVDTKLDRENPRVTVFYRTKFIQN